MGVHVSPICSPRPTASHMNHIVDAAERIADFELLGVKGLIQCCTLLDDKADKI